MSTYMFAVVEIWREGGWALADPLVVDEAEETAVFVPRNIAPPWGWEQIEWYADLSGRRGLPDDASPALRAYLAAAWGNSACALSWLTLADIKQRIMADSDPHFSHFNPDWFTHYDTTNDAHIRVIFWRD